MKGKTNEKRMNGRKIPYSELAVQPKRNPNWDLTRPQKHQTENSDGVMQTNRSETKAANF